MKGGFFEMYAGMACLSLAGGVLGFRRANSRASLVGGIACSVAFVAAAYCVCDVKTRPTAYSVASVTSAFLAYRMGRRGFATQRLFPATMGVTAAVVCAASCYKLYESGQ